MTSILLTLGLALAAPPDLSAWAKRSNLPLAVPDGGSVQQTADGLALVGAGESLLVSAGEGEAALDAALASMWAPFVEAGIRAPTVVEEACTIQGTPAACRGAKLTVGPGAELHLLAAQKPGTDWLLVCLDRAIDRPGVCTPYVIRTP